MLPADKRLRILGIPNRLAFAVVGAAFCVFVEILLNSIGALTWEHGWWSAGAPWLIFLFGYLTFFLVSFWAHDMETIKRKSIAVGAIFAIDLIVILIFGVNLGWI